MSYNVAVRLAGRGSTRAPVRRAPESSIFPRTNNGPPGASTPGPRQGAGRGARLPARLSGSPNVNLNPERRETEVSDSPGQQVLASAPSRLVVADPDNLSTSVLRSRQRRTVRYSRDDPRSSDEDGLRANSREGSQYPKTSSWLGRRQDRQSRGNVGSEHGNDRTGQFPKRGDGSGAARRGKAQSKSRDWFSSISRIQAMEKIAVTSSYSSSFDKKDKHSTPLAASDFVMPFAGGNFSHLTLTLPESHWVTSYVKEVTGGLEGNPNIKPTEKQNIVKTAVDMITSLDPSLLTMCEVPGNRPLLNVSDASRPVIDDDNDLRYEDAESAHG